MAPVLPFLSDSDARLDATVRAIAEAGASSVTALALHLRPGAREWWFTWLRAHRPELVEPYEHLYAGRAYVPPAYQRDLTERVSALTRRYGVGRHAPQTGSPWRAGTTPRPTSPTHLAPPAPDQLALTL